MIKSEKGTSEALECIKKYQKELDEYIHSDKAKVNLGRLLGGFIPIDNLIASAKFADIESDFYLSSRNNKRLQNTLIDIYDIVHNILPIYERFGDKNFIFELKKKGLFRNFEKIFESDIFEYKSKFQELFLESRLSICNGYLAYNIKKSELSVFWNFFMNDPLFLKNEDLIFIYKFEDISFKKNEFFKDDEFGKLIRLLFFSIFSEKYFEKVIDFLLSDFILKGYKEFVSKFLLLDTSDKGDIYEENNILFSVPNCFIDENLKNSKMLYFLEKFGHFRCDKYDEFLVGEFVRNLPLEKIQRLSGSVFTLCYSRGSFEQSDWLKNEILRRLVIPKEDVTFGNQHISLETIDNLTSLYEEDEIINTFNKAIKDYFRNKKEIKFRFDDGIESELIPIYNSELLKSKIDDYIESFKDKKVSYILDCSDRLFHVNTPFVIDKNDVFQMIDPLLNNRPKFGLRQTYCDMHKLKILKEVGYEPTDIFLFVSHYKLGDNRETIDATFYNLKNLINNYKELNIKIFILEDIVRSFDPKDNNLDLELFKKETGLKEFQVVKAEKDMFNKLEKDGFEEIIFE